MKSIFIELFILLYQNNTSRDNVFLYRNINSTFWFLGFSFYFIRKLVINGNIIFFLGLTFGKVLGKFLSREPQSYSYDIFDDSYGPWEV